MKLSQLLYFKTIAETGTLAKAAKKLGVTAPALSIALANLENELGVALFDRQCNRISLNAQGTAYLQRVNKIFEDLESAKTDIQNMSAVSENIEVSL